MQVSPRFTVCDERDRALSAGSYMMNLGGLFDAVGNLLLADHGFYDFGDKVFPIYMLFLLMNKILQSFFFFSFSANF